MDILTRISEVHEWCAARRSQGQSIGFVPTMGYLHEGHMALVQQARAQNDAVLASIFVNPTQFSATEDLSRYPRDFERDCELLRNHNCDAVFAPTPEEMYPEGFATHIHIDGVTAGFEGAVRPTHFDGVALVVTRLLCITTPTALYLGQKDLQQTAVLRRLVLDLGLQCRVVVVPTVRDSDGLAKSSRNVYLSDVQRHQALVLSRALRAVCAGVQSRQTSVEILLRAAQEVLGAEPALHLDYIAIVDPLGMNALHDITQSPDAACIVAGKVGSTRLIDNCYVRQVW